MAVKEGGQHTNVEFETSLLGNHGQSLDASAAAGANSEEQRAWQKRKNIDPKEQIKLVRISHVRYQHPDLDKILIFLKGQSACSMSVILILLTPELKTLDCQSSSGLRTGSGSVAMAQTNSVTMLRQGPRSSWEPLLLLNRNLIWQSTLFPWTSRPDLR